jgi:hypothetical protein
MKPGDPRRQPLRGTDPSEAARMFPALGVWAQAAKPTVNPSVSVYNKQDQLPTLQAECWFIRTMVPRAAGAAKRKHLSTGDQHWILSLAPDISDRLWRVLRTMAVPIPTIRLD